MIRRAYQLLLAGALLLSPLPAAAQSNPPPVVTWGKVLNNTDASGSVSSTNTFQQVFAGVARQGCRIVNTGTHVEYVFPGALAGATTPTAFPLNAAAGAGQAGGAFDCSTPSGGVYQDQISITGTSGDTFVAKQQ